jgi:uncharacterized protein YegP (UPF0339 family)
MTESPLLRGAAAMKFWVFKGVNGQWYWHFKAANGRIVATSGGDGYHNRADCVAAIKLVQIHANAAQIQEV